MEFPVEEDKQKKVEEKTEKVEVEKDDEKENCAVSGGKLKRSESFKQREEKKENSNNKLLRRSESLNKGSASNKLKRSDSLTKTEKTDLNLSKRRQALEAATKKMKRKTGVEVNVPSNDAILSAGPRTLTRLPGWITKSAKRAKRGGRRRQTCQPTCPDQFSC